MVWELDNCPRLTFFLVTASLTSCESDLKVLSKGEFIIATMGDGVVQ